MNIQTCNHEFTDGTCCDNVANQGHLYCRWHLTPADRLLRQHRSERHPRRVVITVSAHPNVTQHNIQQVLDAMLSDRISDKRAGLLLYAIANSMYS